MNDIILVIIFSNKLQRNNCNTETTALRGIHTEITLALNVARSAPVSYCLLTSSRTLHCIFAQPLSSYLTSHQSSKRREMLYCYKVYFRTSFHNVTGTDL